MRNSVVAVLTRDATAQVAGSHQGGQAPPHRLGEGGGTQGPLHGAPGKPCGVLGAPIGEGGGGSDTAMAPCPPWSLAKVFAKLKVKVFEKLKVFEVFEKLMAQGL